MVRRVLEIGGVMSMLTADATMRLRHNASPTLTTRKTRPGVRGERRAFVVPRWVHLRPACADHDVVTAAVL